MLAALLAYPVYQLGLISLLHYTQSQVSGGQPVTFEGFGTYAVLFGDGQFWRVLTVAVLFAAACVAATLLVGCALAVIYVMTGGGGIAGQNLVLKVYAYQKAFAAPEYGLGSAIGVVMLLILLAVTLLYLRLLRRQGEEWWIGPAPKRTRGVERRTAAGGNRIS